MNSSFKTSRPDLCTLTYFNYAHPVCFALFVFLMSQDCFVAHPHDSMGLSAAGNYDIF